MAQSAGMKNGRGGTRAGAGRKISPVISLDPQALTAQLRARLDAKPPLMIPQVLGRQALTMIDAQRAAMERLILASRRAICVDEDEQVTLDCRIEEATELLREFRPDDTAIIL